MERLSTRTGRDGAQRPSSSTRTPAPPPAHRSIRVLVPSDLFDDYVGGWVSCSAFRLLEKRPGVHELQVQLLDAAAADEARLEQVRGYIATVAAKTHVTVVRATAELLGTASEVFGRQIDELEDLRIDEAEWLVSRISTLVGEPA